MKKRLQVLVTTLGILTAVVAATAAPVAAYNPFSDACSRGGSSSAACQASSSDPLTGSGGALAKVVSILSVVGGIVAVIFLTIGGIKYILSNGDSAQISSAKNTIIYSLIGLVVVVIARAIIDFVLNKV